MNLDSLRTAFGPRVFSLGEARVVLGPTAKMTLSRLTLEGRLERVGRGRYRIAPHEARMRVDRARDALRREAVLAAPFRLAFDGPDAVRAWTGGRYQASRPLPGEPVVWLAVHPDDATRLTEWLEERDWRVGSTHVWPEGQGPKAIVRILTPFRWTRLDETPVVTRDEVERIIETDPVAYEGAEEWLLGH